jgi:hypothetical protein
MTPDIQSPTKVTGFAPDCWIATHKQVLLPSVISRKAFIFAKPLIHRYLKHLRVIVDQVCRSQVGDFSFSKLMEPGAML